MSFAYELSGIRYAYNGEPVLEFDELKIRRTGCTALVGANGSGKTTLLDILGFIRRPSRGTIRFNGQDINGQNFHKLRRAIGYVQQKPYLFHSTVYKNVEIGLKLRRTSRPQRRPLVEQQLHDIGLEKLAGRYVYDISGGEAQKVAIARALVLSPEVLILDEPFSHLDRTFKAELEQLLAEIISRGTSTVIFSTHDQLQARLLADQVYTLVNGLPVPVAVTNLFTGVLYDQVFDTGKISISVPSKQGSGTHLAVDANQIVLSRQQLESSMRNSFPGRIIGLTEENGLINVTVEAGEVFRVMVTRAALQDMGLNIGDEVWLSFKSSSVHLF